MVGIVGTAGMLGAFATVVSSSSVLSSSVSTAVDLVG
jgi:hypothetical protein